ncbi:MAG: hypothetical protein NVS2B16_17800 [Chloroflexota bacterium]
MKRVIVLLVVVLGLPHSVLAQPVAHPHPPSCKALPHHPPKGKPPQTQCLAGNVTAVSGTAMEMQPAHGHAIKIIFVKKTIFQTDSGPGTLEGIMPGDFACVTGTLHGHSLTAQLVVFDLTPFPCPLKKPPHTKSQAPDPTT